MLPLLTLVDKRSLSENIADICIQSQIICDSDPKILDAFNIFEDHSVQTI